VANRRTFQRSTRRRTSWEGAAFDLEVVTGASGFVTIVSEAILENVPEPTIVRVRGNMLVRQSAQGAAGTRTNVVYGIKLATASAIAAGIGSIEDPLDGIGSDWLWWDSVAMNTLDTGLGATNSGQTYHRVAIDSKAMRKVGNNTGLVFVVQVVSVTSTATIQTTGAVRVLLKM